MRKMSSFYIFIFVKNKSKKSANLTMAYSYQALKNIQKMQRFMGGEKENRVTKSGGKRRSSLYYVFM